MASRVNRPETPQILRLGSAIGGRRIEDKEVPAAGAGTTVSGRMTRGAVLRTSDAGSGDIAGVVEFQVKTGAAGRNEYNPGRGTRKTDVSVRFYSRAGNR